MPKAIRRRLYIAYGSNLNLSQMAQRCPTATAVGTTVMRNWRLMFRGSRGSAVATIERFHGGKVPVLVWELQPKDERALDHYEGWPNLYYKKTVRVTLNGKQVYAMVYIMNEKYPHNQPGGYYYNVIREGYMKAKFDVDILRKAAEDSKEDD